MNENDKERIYITIEKKKELITEREFLHNNGRREIAKRLDDAKALGDLSENAEYHQAREDQSHMESRITEIEHILKYGEVIKKTNSDKIEVGSSVIILKKDDQKEIKYKIVGTQESDIFEGKIAFSSPLASAMMGKSKGDSFTFKKPSGENQEFSIIDVK